MDFLTRIKAKPREVRARYALGISVLVTLIITLIWLSTLPARFADIDSFSDDFLNTANVADAVPPVVVTPPTDVPTIETEALESLTLDIENPPSMATTTATTGTISTPPQPRVIKIATTSQNAQ